jgi:hypothetical protein
LWLNIFTITEEKIKKFLKNRKRWEKKEIHHRYELFWDIAGHQRPESLEETRQLQRVCNEFR